MARQPKPSGRKLPDKGQPLQSRQVSLRSKSPYFLIVCEGEETEPNYFKGFRLNVKVEVVGTGMNTETLVSFTQQLKDKADREGQPYQEIWVVFDRDQFPPDDFQNAITRATGCGFKVAYSNEAFELWYILHFHYLGSGVTRDQYKAILSKKLGVTYKKNDATMYGRLKEDQYKAIQYAEKLYSSYQPNHNPARDNPCTTVYQLVLNLNAHLM